MKSNNQGFKEIYETSLTIPDNMGGRDGEPQRRGCGVATVRQQWWAAAVVVTSGTGGPTFMFARSKPGGTPGESAISAPSQTAQPRDPLPGNKAS